MRKPHDGHESIAAAARALGIRPDTLGRRLLRGRNDTSPPRRPTLAGPFVDASGHRWATVRALADAHGIHEDTVRKRLLRGDSVADAVRPYDARVAGRRELTRGLR